LSAPVRPPSDSGQVRVHRQIRIWIRQVGAPDLNQCDLLNGSISIRLCVIWIRTAFSLFRSEEDERDEAQRKEDEMILLLKKAKLNLHRGHHQAASSFLHQAVVLAHQTHNTNAIVYTYSLMANLAYVQGELDSAEKLFKAAMSFMLSNGTPLDDNAVIEMGGVRGEETEGRRYREQEVLRKDTRLLLGLCLDSRARYRASTRNLKQAEEDYKRALDICTQEQGEDTPTGEDTLQTLVLMSDLATILDLQGHLETLCRSAGHPGPTCPVGKHGGILLHKGTYGSFPSSFAVHFYQEALRLARQNHDQEAGGPDPGGSEGGDERRRSQEEEREDQMSEEGVSEIDQMGGGGGQRDGRRTEGETGRRKLENGEEEGGDMRGETGGRNGLLHPTLNHEQDPEILKLLPQRQTSP
uniref:Uncharacterized protein n=1 Tax=Sphaeramia orbicularis TaxID=375764 RepID=A0A673BT53_9TELE